MSKRQPYALSYAPPLKHQLTISGAVRLNVGWTGSRADRINSIDTCPVVDGAVVMMENHVRWVEEAGGHEFPTNPRSPYLTGLLRKPELSMSCGKRDSRAQFA